MGHEPFSLFRQLFYFVILFLCGNTILGEQFFMRAKQFMFLATQSKGEVLGDKLQWM